MNKITTNKIDIYDYLTNKIISKLEPTLSLGELDKQKLYLGIITLLINIIKVICNCFSFSFVTFLFLLRYKK